MWPRVVPMKPRERQGRSGAQKRKARGERARPQQCRFVMGRVVAVDGRPASGVAVCSLALVARHGVLRCPAHGAKV